MLRYLLITPRDNLSHRNGYVMTSLMSLADVWRPYLFDFQALPC